MSSIESIAFVFTILTLTKFQVGWFAERKGKETEITADVDLLASIAIAVFAAIVLDEDSGWAFVAAAGGFFMHSVWSAIAIHKNIELASFGRSRR